MTCRWVRWMTVGALGFGVQIGALTLLASAPGLPYPAATALAIASAIVHNFFWHERWTWRDRPTSGSFARLVRLGRFAGATAWVSIVGGALVTALMVEILGLPLLAANLVTVASLAPLNFAAADRLTFVSGSERRHGGGT